VKATGRFRTARLAAFLALAASGAAAQGGGGGSGPARAPEEFSCRLKNADGTPVNKMGSEEICPTYEFFRLDCRRQAAAHQTGVGVPHCPFME
jgi:hypothetical protein